MKILHSLPVLFISLLPVLDATAQDQLSRQPFQERPDKWDDTNWSPAEQDSTGLPGDNFSLQGALTLFKQANTPEEFERLLNTEDNKVNNLDLNGDGNIDYLRVINKKQQQVQVFIIQALVSNQESQDVAVIELEKTGENTAVIQIAGDEDIYGETTLAEPVATSDSQFSAEDNSFNYDTPSRIHGPAAETHTSSIAPAGVIVNVWFWPCVRKVYAPAYVVWTSPWSWINPPVWWRPWRPMPVYAYRPVCHRYRSGYAYAPVHRIPPARVIYYPVRTYSGMVYNRNRVVMTGYRSTRADRGHFRYDGGRYNGNRNNYNGDRYDYNGYRNGNYPRNNGSRNNYNGYYDGRSSGGYRPDSRSGYYYNDNRASRSGTITSGNYPRESWSGSNYQGGTGNYPGNTNGGTPGGSYQGRPGNGNTPNSGRPAGSYQSSPRGSNTQGGRTNGSSSNTSSASKRAGRTR
jgi:hypothetical protein